MCGRYTIFTDEDYDEITKILSEVNKRSSETVKTGEIYPTNLAPVLLNDTDGIRPEPLIWGFPSFRSKSVIINARAETAPEKPMFKSCLFERRCVVPSTGFYEWDAEKNKYLFRLADNPILYMAGLWNEYKGERRYVILTTAPNPSIINVHNRMPLVLRADQVDSWITDDSACGDILQAVPPMLDCVQV
mgnify:CR=1 FL=1